MTRTALGNLAVWSVLLGLAAGSWWLHRTTWLVATPSGERLLWTFGVVAAYLLLCGWFALRHRSSQAASDDAIDRETVVVAHASQTGMAEEIAVRTAQALRDAGMQVSLRALRHLDVDTLQRTRRLLLIASTTGEGDPPDSALRFMRDTMPSISTLPSLRHAVLALGDSNYAQFCAFGRQLDTWLRHTGAVPLFDRVDVDAQDPGAIRHWQRNIGELSGNTAMPDWQPPEYATWTLRERRQLNAGSPGGPIFHLALQPGDDTLPVWRAGDIAEVGCRHAPAAVQDYLSACGHDGSTQVLHAGKRVPLSDVLSASSWPEPAHARTLASQSLADALKPLPHREYSIASVPADGHLALLLRQVRRTDGQLGLGSGWLTEHAPIRGDVALRIRSNAGFHAPDDARPLVLIGNGTGIAGLRALIRERVAIGHHDNWLLFGERTRAHDFHYADEVVAWQRRGEIARVDLAFSRDQGTHRYVQDLVVAEADRMRDWIARGAAIYVCGSLSGMAPGVDAALATLVGRDTLDQMATDGRYRRDVY